MKRLVREIEILLGSAFIASTLATVYIAKNYNIPVCYAMAAVLFIAAMGLLID